MPIVTKIAHLTGHTGSIYSLSEGISPNMVLSGSGDMFLAQWNIDKCLPDTFSIKLPSIIYTSFYDKTAGLLYIGTVEGALHIVDVKARREIKYLKLESGGIFCLLKSEGSGKLFLSTAQGNLIVLHAHDHSVIANIKLSKLKLRSMSLHEADQLLYVADGTGELHVLSVKDLNRQHSFRANGQSCNVVCLHPEEDIVLTGGRDAHLNFYDRKTFVLIKSIPAHNYAIYDIKFLSGTSYFATASRDKTIKLWSSKEMDFLLRISKEGYDAHINSVNTLFWNAPLKHLISAGDDRAIMVWKVE